MKRKPKSHQREAIDSTCSHLALDSRGKIIQPCGSGKTLTALWIWQRLYAQRIVVFVPSLFLVKQLYQEWARELPPGQTEWLAVCSDQTIEGQDSDEPDLSLLNSHIQVTTEKSTVKQFLKRQTDATRIVISTYHSSHLLFNMGMGVTFDIGFFDEAHKTVGEDDKAFGQALLDHYIVIKKRVFLSATPRVVELTNSADDGPKSVFSMDDESLYGPTIYFLSNKQAVEQGLIAPVKLVVPVITTQDISRDHLYTAGVKYGQSEYSALDVAHKLALQQTFKQHHVRKAITFHETIASAQKFHHMLEQHVPECISLHVNGKQNDLQRQKIMQLFQRSPTSILTNCRALTEGVDVPSVDMVAFMHPKRSFVDIVQAIGRAQRLYPGKTHGYLLVPVFVDGHSVDIHQALATSSDYSTLLRTLMVLTELDEELKDKLYLTRRQRGIDASQMDAIVNTNPLEMTVFSTHLDADQLRSAITTLCVERLVPNWEERYGELKSYYEQHHHSSLSKEKGRYDSLAYWCEKQRRLNRDNKLTQRQQHLLSAVEFPWNREEINTAKTLADYRQFVHVFNHGLVMLDKQVLPAFVDSYTQTCHQQGLDKDAIVKLSTELNKLRYKAQKNQLDASIEDKFDQVSDHWRLKPQERSCLFHLKAYRQQFGSLVPTCYTHLNVKDVDELAIENNDYRTVQQMGYAMLSQLKSAHMGYNKSLTPACVRSLEPLNLYAIEDLVEVAPAMLLLLCQAEQRLGREPILDDYQRNLNSTWDLRLRSLTQFIEQFDDHHFIKKLDPKMFDASQISYVKSYLNCFKKIQRDKCRVKSQGQPSDKATLYQPQLRENSQQNKQTNCRSGSKRKVTADDLVAKVLEPPYGEH